METCTNSFHPLNRGLNGEGEGIAWDAHTRTRVACTHVLVHRSSSRFHTHNPGPHFAPSCLYPRGAHPQRVVTAAYFSELLCVGYGTKIFVCTVSFLMPMAIFKGAYYYPYFRDDKIENQQLAHGYTLDELGCKTKSDGLQGFLYFSVLIILQHTFPL